MTAPDLIERLEVRSRPHSYEVVLGRNILDQSGALVAALPSLRAGSVCGVVTDERVAPLYAEMLMRSLGAAGFKPRLFVVPAGEGSKSMERVASTAESLIGHGLDRRSFLVALGGGVVGDLAGFVASIYQRGIPYVQVPTTVVSQVDSAIGGKTGVNTPSGKNLLGSFHSPALVIADVATLDTLPTREFNEGFAEIIKHAVIRDAALLAQVSAFQRGDGAALRRIVRRNLEIKAAIVAEDEHERLDVRALLNFGHTVGHGIEQAAGYGQLLHGEAISLGMVAAARLSVEKAGMTAESCQRILACLRDYGLPTVLHADVSTDAILASLWRDKKFEAGAIRFVLAPALGQARMSLSGEVTADDIRRTIEALRSRA